MILLPRLSGFPALTRWLVPLGMASLIVAASAAPMKIACIGDSITEGAGLANPSLESYPIRLQRLLGSNYVVRNYGVSGRTLLKQGDLPYWNEPAYTQSRDWEPDCVIIKLGTNDSKPQNWRYGTNFVADFEALIASYARDTTVPGNPRVILCTPAPVFRTGAFSINPGIVATNIAPAVRDLAGRLGLTTVDFQSRLANHNEWFPDTVHPNTRGMAVMAALVFETFQEPALPPDEPRLRIERIPNGRAVIRWPAGHGGLVLQTRANLTSSGAAWTVADQVPWTDGDQLRLTNSPGAARFYRLWQP